MGLHQTSGRACISASETPGHAAEPSWTGLGEPQGDSHCSLRSRGNNGNPGPSLEQESFSLATAVRVGHAEGRRREDAYYLEPKGKSQLSCDLGDFGSPHS